MDDEDMGEFGIAPQTVKATDEYAQTKKRKKQIFVEGPIPGEPVLETLLEAGNETIGYFLMKNMNRKHKKYENAPRVYGCAMPSNLEDETEAVENDFDKVYCEYLSKPKCNTCGLGYIGLDKTKNNFQQPSKLMVCERNNKKLSIAGQAFGVGAFEDDDEDIYSKDDMSRYDFELTSEKTNDKNKNVRKLIFNLFIIASGQSSQQENFPPPTIPSNFSGKHNVKKSRFDSVPAEQVLPQRKEMNVSVRAKYLGEETQETEKPKDPNKNEISKLLMSDRFVSAQQEDDVNNLLEKVTPTVIEHGSSEMRAAAKLKMFGPLTRITTPWQPNSLICKKFNVPDPKLEETKEKKRTKHLIFEYQKHTDDPLPEHKVGLEIQKDEAVEIVTKIPTEIVEIEASVTEPSQIDHTDRVNVSKNIDLFKAVFLSSDSEDDDEEAMKVEEVQRKELLTATVVSEPLVPKIKSTKEGILSNINFSHTFSRKVVDKSETPSKEVHQEDSTYGPRLPSVLVSTLPVIATEVNNDDEWVEKGMEQKQKKHHKKHKKSKKKSSKK
ncbi:hypothetical protein FQA39_LY07760 [Lamprigera yunnana]|nr:hypothetical protein FQA39_LY07760 [Lamprigera yunnana]